MASAEATDALVVGAGPAGLMAAEVLAANGARVVLADRMPSPGRKFLMAGKSGLNLTKDEDEARYLAAFGSDEMARIAAGFGPDAVREWARGLGQEVFTGTSGRVFPVAMKASPLLRAWLSRLAAGGVEMRARWRWTGWDAGAALFATPSGDHAVTAGVTILALGGASWRRLGSDGLWVGTLDAEGVPLASFRPANGGLAVAWSEPMRRHLGSPVKGVALTAGAVVSRGEFVISERGLEGGGIYAVFAAVRDGAGLTLDLLPDLATDEVARRLARPRGKATRSEHFRKTLRLDPVRLALLHEFGRPLPEDAALAAVLKALPLRHDGPGPIDEAISTAGGVRWDAVSEMLELKRRRGVFVAGEMLDWEAPTGGYLIGGCLATGRHAGLAAAGRLAGR